MNIGSNKLYKGMNPIEVCLAPADNASPYSSTSRYLINTPFEIQLLEDADEEDSKTRIAQGIKPIPKGTELRVDSILWNWYGIFLEVEYNDRIYSIDPKICKYIRMLA